MFEVYDPHLNISNSSTLSHPSKGENGSRDRRKSWKMYLNVGKMYSNVTIVGEKIYKPIRIARLVATSFPGYPGEAYTTGPGA